jgi:hypothetical protein
MQILLAILSAGLLGFIIFFAVSPKSSRLLKISALIALGLIALSVGVCGLILIKGSGKAVEAIPLPVFQDTPVDPAKKTNMAAIVSFIIVFLFILGMVVVVTLRDKKILTGETKKTDKPSVFQRSGELAGLEVNGTKADTEEDSFDLGLD